MDQKKSSQHIQLIHFWQCHPDNRLLWRNMIKDLKSHPNCYVFFLPCTSLVASFYVYAIHRLPKISTPSPIKEPQPCRIPKEMQTTKLWMKSYMDLWVIMAWWIGLSGWTHRKSFSCKLQFIIFSFKHLYTWVANIWDGISCAWILLLQPLQCRQSTATCDALVANSSPKHIPPGVENLWPRKRVEA